MDKLQIEDETRAQRVQRVLGVLLRRHPEAVVGALSSDAAAAIIDVPESIGLDPVQPRLAADGGMAAKVDPADRAQIARMWTEARNLGVSSAVVRMDSGEISTLYLLDFRAEHGVLVLVGAPGSDPLDANLVKGNGDDIRRPPRVSRIVKDSTATIVSADDAFERMLGWTVHEVVGTRSLMLVHPDDHDTAVEHWIHMLAMAGPSHPIRLRHQHKDGRWIWIEVTNHNRIDEHDHVVAEMVDVSEEVAALDALAARQQLLEQVTEALPIGLLHADVDGCLLYANQRLSEITGLVVGDFLTGWIPNAVTSGSQLEEMLATALSGHPADTVLEVLDAVGAARFYSMRVRPFTDSSGLITGVTAAVEDVTADVMERRQLEMRAATDSLTGCFNRSATLALAQDALDALGTERDSGGVAVVFVDADGLKSINDQYGHAAGDALLDEVALRLRGAVRARDVVGRFGGDEFVVVLPNVNDADQALTVATWMASRVTKKPFVFDGQELPLKASVGVAWTDSPCSEASTVIRKADAAMYISKRDGQGQPVLA